MTQPQANKAAVQQSIAKQPTNMVKTTMEGMKSNEVSGTIAAYKAQIAQALPKHLTADRVIQIATTMISRSPEIAKCTKASLIGAVMQASILGFEPVQALGQCYFVPFWNSKINSPEVQFIIGYRGMIELARRSGQVSTIYAQAVYENDEFNYQFGLDPQINHIPALGDRGALIYVYAVAKFKDGAYAFEVMSKNDVDKIRTRGKAKQFSPWETDYDEMAKKTVIRRLFKSLPTSIERAAMADNAVVSLEDYSITNETRGELNHVEQVDYREEPAQEPEVIEEVKQPEEVKPTPKGKAKAEPVDADEIPFDELKEYPPTK